MPFVQEPERAATKHTPEIVWSYNALSLAQALNFTEKEIAKMLGCDLDWLQKNPYSPELQEKVSRLVEIVWNVYYLLNESKENLHQWLESEHPQLGNRSPKSYLLQGNIKEVEHLVYRLEAELVV